jgi:hypothetical protein
MEATLSNIFGARSEDKMEATLHLYVGGTIEAKLDVAPLSLHTLLTGKGVGNGQASP